MIILTQIEIRLFGMDSLQHYEISCKDSQKISFEFPDDDS